MDTIANYPTVLAQIICLPLFGIVAKFFKAPFERIAKWYLYIAVFSVLIVMNSIFFPFIGGKDYFFRFTIELSLIFVILWWAFEAKQGEVEGLIKTMAKKPLFIAVTVFAIIFIFACIFAVDPHAAFWSNYERGEGGFQMIHYYLFFALLALMLRTEKSWENIFKLSLIAAGGMIIYGICGNFGASGFIGPYAGGGMPTSFWHQLIDGRFQGSLGNPAYVAPYLIFSIFFAIYLWVKKTARKAATWLTHTGYALLIFIYLIFFILSQTRGAFLGLGAGIFVALFYWAFAAKGSLRRWSLGLIIVMLLMGVGIFGLRNSPILQKVPEGRLLQISFSDATAQTRFWTWGSAWEGFLARPVLGWGPENFTPVFDQYFNPKHYIPGTQSETWYDRAHSVFFDYLAETGILGFLSYLAIFIVFTWEFFKHHVRRAAADYGEVFVRGLILAVPAAYLVQGVAIFDVFPMYLSLFLFMAFAYYYLEPHTNEFHH